MAHKILRLPQVISLTGLSRSSIYLRIKHKHFPRPISLGGRAVGWVEQDVIDWIECQIQASTASHS